MSGVVSTDGSDVFTLQLWAKLDNSADQLEDPDYAAAQTAMGLGTFACVLL